MEDLTISIHNDSKYYCYVESIDLVIEYKLITIDKHIEIPGQ